VTDARCSEDTGVSSEQSEEHIDSLPNSNNAIVPRAAKNVSTNRDRLNSVTLATITKGFNAGLSWYRIAAKLQLKKSAVIEAIRKECTEDVERSDSDLLHQHLNEVNEAAAILMNVNHEIPNSQTSGHTNRSLR